MRIFEYTVNKKTFSEGNLTEYFDVMITRDKEVALNKARRLANVFGLVPTGGDAIDEVRRLTWLSEKLSEDTVIITLDAKEIDQDIAKGNYVLKDLNDLKEMEISKFIYDGNYYRKDYWIQQSLVKYLGSDAIEVFSTDRGIYEKGAVCIPSQDLIIVRPGKDGKIAVSIMRIATNLVLCNSHSFNKYKGN